MNAYMWLTLNVIPTLGYATLCYIDFVIVFFYFIVLIRTLHLRSPTTTLQLFWYLLITQQMEETLLHCITPYQPGLRQVMSDLC